MRVYVGAKFENKDEVRRAHKMLREAGHEVTYDWTPHSAEGVTGAALITKFQKEATEDALGVLNAEAMIFLHNPNCQGGFIELGMAIAAGAIVVVVAGRPTARQFPIFYFHPAVHMVDTLEAAVNFLTWAGGAFAGAQ